MLENLNKRYNKVPQEFKELGEKLETKIAGYLKKASIDEGCWIPLAFADFLKGEGLIKITEDLSSMMHTGGNDISYGLTDSGRELYLKLKESGYYKKKTVKGILHKH